jgi:hypothetical protein
LARPLPTSAPLSFHFESVADINGLGKVKSWCEPCLPWRRTRSPLSFIDEIDSALTARKADENEAKSTHKDGVSRSTGRYRNECRDEACNWCYQPTARVVGNIRLTTFYEASLPSVARRARPRTLLGVPGYNNHRLGRRWISRNPCQRDGRFQWC